MTLSNDLPDFNINKAQQEYLPTLYQQFIHFSRYSRWMDDKKRRETWPETVTRYILFFKELYHDELDQDTFDEIHTNILQMKVLPSMRAMWTAGKALQKDNAAAYNCAYSVIDNIKVFSEAFYLLLVGCFHPDQLIATPHGNIKISEITVNTYIIAFNTENNEFVVTKPSAVIVNESKTSKKLILTFSDGSLVKCTDNHTFLISSGEWKEAKNLLPTDEIVNYDVTIYLVSKKEFYDYINYVDLHVPELNNYVLSNGLVVHNCGFGYSVERQEIAKLPPVPDELYPSDTIIIVKDSKLGWVQGYNELISLLYSGRIPNWDLSLVRPAGSRLKTFGGRACLTGDTIVYKDRKNSRGYNEITIKELFDMKTTGKQKFFSNASQCGTEYIDKIKLRALDEEYGVFFRNQLIDVINNGIAPVYEVLTENGYRIKATDNHRFMNEIGEYMILSDFSIDDFIAVNGSPERKTGKCNLCSVDISRRAIHCRPCVNKLQLKEDCLETTARSRQECQQHKKDYCEKCEITDIKLHIHHRDRNSKNNHNSNLETLCSLCHTRLHAKEDTFGDAYSHKYLSFDKIISITYVGVEQVYDLVMEGPNHNFVANGFVSHNSGPEPLDLLFKQTIGFFKKAVGRRLHSIECHGIVTSIAAAVLCGGVRRCQLYDTKVLLNDGTKKQLNEVKVGDWVLGPNKEYIEVTNVFDNGQQELVKVHLEDGTFFECTEEHKWFVFDNDTHEYIWVETKNLDKGNYSMIEPSIKFTKIVSIEYTHTTGHVYDIEVDDPSHTFYVESPNGAKGLSHNSALISLSNLSDERMRMAKSGQWWLETPNFAFANNSVAYTEKPDMGIFMKEWTALYESKSGERGFFNRQGAIKHLKKFDLRDPNASYGVNPCITGDTLVAVADGRQTVSIADLAKEEKDVMVYCLDDNNELTIAKMVNPRITGYQVDVYEVELEDNFKIRTTSNHKFLTKERGYVEVKDMKIGESLTILAKHQFKNNKYSPGEYYWALTFNNTEIKEHKFIAEHHFGIVPDGHIVHHKDFNSLNNDIMNLQICSLDEHNRIHNFYKTDGKNNGRYIDVSNEELKNHFISLTKYLGRQITNIDWKEYVLLHDLPIVIRTFRGIGNVISLSKWAAEVYGIFYHDNVDTRVLKRYHQALLEGYDCEIKDRKLVFHKTCEYSGESFDTIDKEQMIKTEYCAAYLQQHNKLTNNNVGRKLTQEEIDKGNETRKVTFDNSRIVLKEQQAKVWVKLKFDLNREPFKKEWQSACNDEDVSFEMCRSGSPFQKYKQLKEYAVNYNHKVKSITYVGKEDVYNGTVENYHNFFVGSTSTEEATTKNGHKRLIYINNLQCGEIILKSGSSAATSSSGSGGGLCNLSTIIVKPEDTYSSLMNKAKIAALIGTLQSTLTNFRFLSKQWKKTAEEERLLGVSMSGIMDHAFLSGKLKTIKDDSGVEIELPEFLNRLRDYVWSVNKEYAEKLGISSSLSVTCVKPEGCMLSSCFIRTFYKNKIQNMTLLEIFEKNGYTEKQISYLSPRSFVPATANIKVFDENNKLTKITELFVNGLAEVYEIEFEDGFVTKCTEQHKFLTMTGFKEAKDLTLEDNIVSYT